MTMIIAFTVHQTIISRKNDVETYLTKFVVIALVVPLIITIFPLLFNSYGIG